MQKQFITQPIAKSGEENAVFNPIVDAQVPLSQRTSGIHMPRANTANYKDIRETELYQESFPGSRVEANTLAGMPLTQGNVPTTEAILGP